MLIIWNNEGKIRKKTIKKMRVNERDMSVFWAGGLLRELKMK